VVEEAIAVPNDLDDQNQEAKSGNATTKRAIRSISSDMGLLALGRGQAP